MKKRCNGVITRKKSCCNNQDLTCYVSELSPKTDDSIKTDFSNQQHSTRKQSNNSKDINLNTLLEIYRKKFSGCYNDKESIVEAQAILAEL